MAGTRDLFRYVTGVRGVAALLRKRSLNEGLWHGRKGWLAVGAVVWGARGISRAVLRDEKVLMREVLKPGDTVRVHQAITKPTRRQARRAGKGAP